MLDIVLIGILTGILVPFIGRETIGYAAAMFGVGIEFHEAGDTMVANVSPGGEHERVGGNFKVLNHVGI